MLLSTEQVVGYMRVITLENKMLLSKEHNQSHD
jgi:hypothetical protein